MNIKSASETTIDQLSLGECMVRLSPPGHGRIEFANTLEVWVGGGEYNVAYGLVRLGLRTAFVSRLVDNPVGRIILNHGRAAGVDMSHVVMAEFDGVGRKDRIGLNFTEVGTSVRASVTMYDRGHSAAMNMQPGMIDFNGLFNKGVRWLHTGGIFTALSDGTAGVVSEALQAAKAAGTVVSYDLNFRSKLWNSQKAQKVTAGMIKNVDVLIGNEEDFQKVLGFEVPGVNNNLSNLHTSAYENMVQQVVKKYPHIKAVGTTLREVKSGLVNNWSAILWLEGTFYHSRRYEGLEIEDRVGGGDGFCSGLAYALLTGMSPQEAVDIGAAHGALLQSTRGDTSQINLSELRHVFQGGSARIIR
jgi:2-dehydro-3-deoxygluconokinase